MYTTLGLCCCGTGQLKTANALGDTGPQSIASAYEVVGVSGEQMTGIGIERGYIEPPLGVDLRRTIVVPRTAGSGAATSSEG